MKYHEVVTKKKGYNRLIREKALPIEIKSLKKSLKKLLKKSLKKSLLKIKRLTIFRPAPTTAIIFSNKLPYSE